MVLIFALFNSCREERPKLTKGTTQSEPVNLPTYKLAKIKRRGPCVVSVWVLVFNIQIDKELNTRLLVEGGGKEEGTKGDEGKGREEKGGEGGKKEEVASRGDCQATEEALD